MIYCVAPVAFLLGALGHMAFEEKMILAYWLVVAVNTVLHSVAVNKYAK